MSWSKRSFDDNKSSCYNKKVNINDLLCSPGAPCNNFQGYCDVFQKCRDVDANGPLSRLKKLLFNEQTFNEIRDWIMVILLTLNAYHNRFKFCVCL